MNDPDYLDNEEARDLLHDGATDDPNNKDWSSARVAPAVEKRIYDQPDHSHYGPARRLNLMIMQLSADQSYEAADRAYSAHWDETWDFNLMWLMKHLGMPEPKAQRKVLRNLLWVLHGKLE